MRKYAILDDNIVVQILDLDEDGYIIKAREHQLVVDVEDLVIPPQIGWIISLNKLSPPPAQVFDLREYTKNKIKFFQESAPELLRDLYLTNTLLGITVQQSDDMFDDYFDVLCRIREGAWPTAIYRLSQKEPSGFVTQEMINNWTSILLARMNS